MSQNYHYENNKIVVDVSIEKSDEYYIINASLKNKSDKSIYIADFGNSNYAYWPADSSLFLTIGWDQYHISHDKKIPLIAVTSEETFKFEKKIPAKSIIVEFILEINYIPYSETNRKIRKGGITVFDYLRLMDWNRFIRYPKYE